MPANAVVRARIDKDLKEEATIVLASIGLTVSDAFRMMLMRVVAEKALPFDPLVPNAETIAALRDARRGKVRSFENVDALLEDLNAPD
jgi:DNA-damage-inducible protein J